MSPVVFQTRLPVRDYDLSATVSCGQAFRWRETEAGWEGVIGSRWVRLRGDESFLVAETSSPPGDWRWLADYLQTDLDLATILATFPDDEPLRASVAACRGLRLLRQEPWECLASFILSSTKQIVQIRQIVELLSARFGSPLDVPATARFSHAFPTASQLASVGEADLRACKMGFRAPNLLAAARAVDSRTIDLAALSGGDVDAARESLMELAGVGPKIANCVLLFAYGYQQAFPVDVWVMKALRQLYFPKRRLKPERLRRFVSNYFGPNAGYAQQYLFHYMRTRS